MRLRSPQGSTQCLRATEELIVRGVLAAELKAHIATTQATRGQWHTHYDVMPRARKWHIEILLESGVPTPS